MMSIGRRALLPGISATPLARWGVHVTDQQIERLLAARA
jgi:hypothetical protein